MSIEETLNKIENALEGYTHLDELAKDKQDPFKILISTILSARTRDANTKIATEKLFKKFNTPKLIAEADIDDLQDLIKSSGFYKVKAARIKEVSRIIQEDYNGNVPNKYDELILLPGVGSKTANCVLVYAFRIPAIPCDIHVHRISNRLGWVKTKKPEETEKELKKIIPRNQWIRLNRLFVKFGQQICLSRNPKHNKCPVERTCPKINFSISSKKKSIST